jgi:hypothetical protein
MFSPLDGNGGADKARANPFDISLIFFAIQSDKSKNELKIMRTGSIYQ